MIRFTIAPHQPTRINIMSLNNTYTLLTDEEIKQCERDANTHCKDFISYLEALEYFIDTARTSKALSLGDTQ